MRNVLFSILLITSVAFSAVGQKRLGTSSETKTSSTSSSNSNKSIDPNAWENAITKQSAWTVSDVLATRESVEVDTIMENYAQSVAIPSMQFGTTSAITGNLGAEGINMNYFERPGENDFFFANTLDPYLPSVENTPFFNTRVPMTLASFNTGGSSNTTQDWLKVRLSGNINKRAQVGGWLSYLYSKGMYENQAAKHFNWGFNGSYLGERYQMLAMFNNWSNLNKENGGIEDDLYILDPAEVQGGSTSIDSKQIPVRLQDAHSHLIGHEFWMTHRYRMGFNTWNEEDSVNVFTPVSQVFWTFDFRSDEHRFVDDASADDAFFNDTYFTAGSTYDCTKQWVMRNSLGIELLEGFNKWAKAGLSAYLMHEVAHYTQTPADTIEGVDTGIAPSATEHALLIGGRLAKEQGATLRYNAEARVGVLGAKAGEVEVSGNIDFRLRIRQDTASIRAYVDFTNLEPSYFLQQYVSNHYIWDNNFGKTRKLRFGGILDIPQTGTQISAGLENVQNLVYFGSDGKPTQYSGNVQVFSASLNQDLQFGIFNWQNRITYQKSSNQSVIPLPDLTIYSNMFLLFRVATLRAQIGVDCTYMTRYSALGYNPAVMAFTNENQTVIGNYPMLDVYANLKLKKVKFYVMVSHVNQGLFGGNNYFSALHYPLNPRRFMFGLCVDFAN